MKKLFLVLSISLFVCFCFSFSFAKKSEALSKDISQSLLIAANDVDSTDKSDEIIEETTTESYEETEIDENSDAGGEETDNDSYETEVEQSDN